MTDEPASTPAPDPVTDLFDEVRKANYPEMMNSLYKQGGGHLLPIDVVGLTVYELSDHLRYFPADKGSKGPTQNRTMAIERMFSSFQLLACVALPHLLGAGVIPTKEENGQGTPDDAILTGWKRLNDWVGEWFFPAIDRWKPPKKEDYRRRAIKGAFDAILRALYGTGSGRRGSRELLIKDAMQGLRAAGWTGSEEDAVQEIAVMEGLGVSMPFYTDADGMVRLGWMQVRDLYRKQHPDAEGKLVPRDFPTVTAASDALDQVDRITLLLDAADEEARTQVAKARAEWEANGPTHRAVLEASLGSGRAFQRPTLAKKYGTTVAKMKRLEPEYRRWLADLRRRLAG